MSVVPPFELLEAGQGYSWATRRAVLAACKEMGTERVIVRTSEKSDWDGMVDTMPTIVTGNWALSIMRAISKVRRRCESADLLKYAEREANGYDPARVTVSIAPHIQPSDLRPRTLVTQHPTLDDVHLVDISSPAPLGIVKDDHFEHSSFDYNENGKLTYHYTTDDGEHHAKTALSLAKRIEESGILPSGEAFQFEGGLHMGGAKLFQIRKLADKRRAGFDLKDRGEMVRQFGTTPPEGRILSVARMGERDGYKDFEGNNPDSDYLFVVDRGTASLDISEQPSERMKGFLMTRSWALSHQATRFVKMALRQEDGVASMFHLDLDAKTQIRHGDRVLVICDGVKMKIKKI